GGPLREVAEILVAVRRTRDVHVNPWKILDELPEEDRRGARAGGAAAAVLDVGDFALHLLAIVVEERQVPAALAGARPRIEHFPHERVVIAEYTGRDMTEGHDAGAGKRRRIDHGGGLEAPRVRQHVSQHQSPFRVRVDDLNELAEVTLHDIAGIHGGARWHVGGTPDETHRVE